MRFNRTNVELKQNISAIKFFSIICFNRTNVELKCSFINWMSNAKPSFNRTNVELKYKALIMVDPPMPGL